MSITPQHKERKYKRLAEMLLEALGHNHSQRWLSEQTLVTQEAVSQWLSGITRPRPQLLGQIAALLSIDPLLLIDLAGYNTTLNVNARDKTLAACKMWKTIYDQTSK